MTPQQALLRIDTIFDEVLNAVRQAVPGASTQIWEQLHHEAVTTVYEGIKEAEIGSYARTRDQAVRYMDAIYGPGWFYMAPETIPNLVNRWIWAIAEGRVDAAEEIMDQIVTHWRARNEQEADTSPGTEGA